jgi:hypothetical protein
MRRFRLASAAPRLVAAAALLAAVAGCETEKSYAEKKAKEAAIVRPDPIFVVRHHVGGTHHRSLAVGDAWYATYANSLLVLSDANGIVLASLELMPYGRSGGAVDIVATPNRLDRLFVLLDGTAVVEVSIADPKAPEVVSTRTRRDIGFAPRAIGAADGEIFISGEGGVVAWSAVLPRPAAPIDAREGDEADGLPRPALAALARERGGLGPVAPGAEGPVVVAGRRVHRLADGAFVGAATMLAPLPDADAQRLGVPGALVFILQSNSGARVGLMGPDIREIDSAAVAGTARRVRVHGNHLFAMNDDEIVVFPILRAESEGTLFLGEPEFIPVRGARDIAQLGDNRFGVVGSFGRALYRWRPDASGPGDTFFEARREPSRLTYATTDRRRILAGGSEGSWLYRIGDEVNLVNQPVPQEDGRKRTATGGWGNANVDEGNRAVRIRPRGAMVPPAVQGAAPTPLEVVWRPQVEGIVYGVESFAGRIWIWHEHGVDVVAADANGVRGIGHFAIEGPVRYLFPQRVGGAVAYVSEYGGFGVLDFVDREILPSVPGPRLVDLDGDGLDDVTLSAAEREGEAGLTGRIPVPVGSDRFGDGPGTGR